MSWLRRSTGELEGTGYIEFLPGLFRNTHWNPGSVFLAAEVFGYIEPVFARLGPKYNPCGPTTVGKTLWPRVLADLDDLARTLDSEPTDEALRQLLKFPDQDVEQSFLDHRTENIAGLRETVGDLTAWVRETLQKRDVISVLGL